MRALETHRQTPALPCPDQGQGLGFIAKSVGIPTQAQCVGQCHRLAIVLAPGMLDLEGETHTVHARLRHLGDHTRDPQVHPFDGGRQALLMEGRGSPARERKSHAGHTHHLPSDSRKLCCLTATGQPGAKTENTDRCVMADWPQRRLKQLKKSSGRPSEQAWSRAAKRAQSNPFMTAGHQPCRSPTLSGWVRRLR